MKFNVAELIRRAGKTKQPELVLAPIVGPQGLEVELRNIYLRVVRAWGVAARERIMPVYAATLGEGVRDAPADAEETIDDVGVSLTRLVLTLNSLLEDWVVRVERWHRGRVVQQFIPTGVNLETLLGRGDVARTLQTVLAENTALIRSLSDQMRNGISGAVFRGLTNRSTAAEVAKEIRAVADVGRRRSRLIASDQLQKVTATLDQERQTQLGIKEFQWQRSHKLHPRPRHVARDGRRFKWNSAVAKTDPPGRAIHCGCKARAVVDL